MPPTSSALSLGAAAAISAATIYALSRGSRRRIEGPWLLRNCTTLASTLTTNEENRPPTETDGYTEVDVLLGTDGKIEAVGAAGSIAKPSLFTPTLDCTNKLLLPGFVNAHTHSTEHLSRGLIPPVPLDLWVLRLLSTVGEAIGYFSEPSEALHLAALHCGVESLLSGCTSVLDHCYTSSVADAEAVTSAYQAVGIRAFFAPMLNDDAVRYENYIPLAADADARNKARVVSTAGSSPAFAFAGLGKGGLLRTKRGPSDPEACTAAVALWEAIVGALHRPAEGVEIVIGPVTAYSCSTAMLKAAAGVRRKHRLHGHIHLLESRAQKIEACRDTERFPGGSAVRHRVSIPALLWPLRLSLWLARSWHIPFAPPHAWLAPGKSSWQRP